MQVEITITDSQIRKMAEERVKELVDKRVQNVLDEIFYQDMSERINEFVEIAVNKRVTDEKVDRAFNNLDKNFLIECLTDELIGYIKERLRGGE